MLDSGAPPNPSANLMAPDYPTLINSLSPYVNVYIALEHSLVCWLVWSDSFQDEGKTGFLESYQTSVRLQSTKRTTI